MAYILECRHVDKTYQTGKLEVPVLYDVNFTMEEGEYVAIMGPSGSGKSTLMNIIGCLDRLTDGELLLDGEPVSSLSEKELAELRLKKIGFVFQTFQLLAGETALENVELPLTYARVPRKNRREIAQKALERVGLSDRVDFKPSQLSGGQKQRVAIARALVNKPKILLADEPTGALDSKSGRQVMELFRSLNQDGMSVLMITHDREIASYADRIVEIRDGVLMNAPGSPVPGPERDGEESAAGGRTAAARPGGIQAVMDEGFFDDVDEEASDELAGGFFEGVEDPEETAGGDSEGILGDALTEPEVSIAEGSGDNRPGGAASEADVSANAGTGVLSGEALPEGIVTRLSDADIEAGPDEEASFAVKPQKTAPDASGKAAFAGYTGGGEADEMTGSAEKSTDEAVVEVLHLAGREETEDGRELINASGGQGGLPEEV